LTARKAQEAEIVPEADTPICLVPDCSEPVYLRGLCEVHWADPKN
jgi:hypothetical protein